MVWFLLLSVVSPLSLNLQKKYEESKIVQNISKQLEFIDLEVNGEPIRIMAHGTLSIVEGDLVTIKDAALRDRSNPLEVNVVGFRNQNQRSPSEDRNLVINTARDMMEEWALAPNRYIVTAYSGKDYHGYITLKLQKPKLEFADIEVNGNVLVVREGDNLKLNEKDRFKVKRVVTNLSSSKDINFELKQPEIQDKSRSRVHFVLEISKAGFVFSRIPIEILK